MPGGRGRRVSGCEGTNGSGEGHSKPNVEGKQPSPLIHKLIEASQHQITLKRAMHDFQEYHLGIGPCIKN